MSNEEFITWTLLVTVGMLWAYFSGRVDGRRAEISTHRCPGNQVDFKTLSYWQTLHRKVEAQRALWHGKYAIVKHENNQLRKKVSKYAHRNQGQ